MLREQKEAEEQRQKEAEERRKRREEATRQKRMLEAAFDGEVEDMKKLLKEVSGKFREQLITCLIQKSQILAKTCPEFHA